MKIVETVELINEDKVFMGHKEMRLTLDTDTGRLDIDTPAMFTNPVIRLDLLEAKIAKLKEHMERERGVSE